MIRKIKVTFKVGIITYSANAYCYPNYVSLDIDAILTVTVVNDI